MFQIMREFVKGSKIAASNFRTTTTNSAKLRSRRRFRSNILEGYVGVKCRCNHLGRRPPLFFREAGHTTTYGSRKFNGVSLSVHLLQLITLRDMVKRLDALREFSPLSAGIAARPDNIDEIPHFSVRKSRGENMDFDSQQCEVGEQLGIEGFDQLVERAEAVCICERQRIELANQPLIVARKAEYQAELEKHAELEKRLYQAKPPHEHRARLRRIILSWAVASVLFVAGFILSVLTFEPFRFGLKSYLYCVGIALATPFLVDEALRKLASDKLLKVLVSVAAIGAIASMMTLAAIRGELMAKHMENDAPAVTIEGEESQTAQPKTSFYDDTVPLLQIVMVLLAFSMEVGAGIAMHEAERVSANLGESYDELQQARNTQQAKLSRLAEEIIALENESAIFVTKFWRDFHWAVLKRSVSSAAKILAVAVLAFLFLSSPPAKAQQPLELVILLDLSQSVDAHGPDRQSEFQKNVAAISTVLRQAPAGAHITILGITNDSFSHPYILLSATVASDPGYFGRNSLPLASTWTSPGRSVAMNLNPPSPEPISSEPSSSQAKSSSKPQQEPEQTGTTSSSSSPTCARKPASSTSRPRPTCAGQRLYIRLEQENSSPI